jgi:hypothetical protein
MQPIIAAAQCITPLAFSDAALGVAPALVNAPPDQAASLAFTVSATGMLQIDGVMVTITIPAAITVISAVPAAGSCSTGAGAVTCDLGTVPGSSSRRIDLSVRGTQEGTFVANATLTAANDADSQNNAADATLVIGRPRVRRRNDNGGGAFGLLRFGLLLSMIRRRVPAPGVSARAE